MDTTDTKQSNGASPMTETNIRRKLEIRKAGDNELYFVFKLPGHGMFVSRFFDDIAEVYSAIAEMKDNLAENNNYVRKLSPPAQVYFIFRVRDQEPTGQSTMYRLVSIMEISIEFMKTSFACSEVVDLTG